MTLSILYLLSILAFFLFMVGLPAGTRETPETLERQFWMRPLSPTPEIFPVTDEEMAAWVDGLWPGARYVLRDYAAAEIDSATFIDSMDREDLPETTANRIRDGLPAAKSEKNRPQVNGITIRSSAPGIILPETESVLYLRTPLGIVSFSRDHINHWTIAEDGTVTVHTIAGVRYTGRWHDPSANYLDPGCADMRPVKWDCGRDGHLYTDNPECTQCGHRQVPPETPERRAELVAHFSKPLETPESQGL